MSVISYQVVIADYTSANELSVNLTGRSRFCCSCAAGHKDEGQKTGEVAESVMLFYSGVIYRGMSWGKKL
jgi:hypothetical protein